MVGCHLNIRQHGLNDQKNVSNKVNIWFPNIWISQMVGAVGNRSGFQIVQPLTTGQVWTIWILDLLGIQMFTVIYFDDIVNASQHLKLNKWEGFWIHIGAIHNLFNMIGTINDSLPINASTESFFRPYHISNGTSHRQLFTLNLWTTPIQLKDIIKLHVIKNF
jgi:hypothetical protein